MSNSDFKVFWKMNLWKIYKILKRLMSNEIISRKITGFSKYMLDDKWKYFPSNEQFFHRHCMRIAVKNKKNLTGLIKNNFHEI